MQSRTTLRWTIIALSAVGVLMMGYIIYQIYLLM